MYQIHKEAGVINRFLIARPWSERTHCMENGQRVRLARFARLRLLRHALPISLLILRKKPDCFAVYFSKRKLCWFVSTMLDEFFRTIRAQIQDSWRRLI